MKRKLKYIFSTIIVAVIALFEIVSISQAANYNQIEKLLADEQKAIGKTIGTIGKERSDINLLNGKYLYCVQRWKDAGEKNTYRVEKYIDIEGNTAKIYNSSNSNPTTYTNDSNAVLAYILGGGDYAKGFGEDAELGINPRQFALWMYWNTWAGKAQNSLGDINYTHSGNDGITYETLGQDLYNKAQNLIKNGENYSKNPGTIASIKMTNSDNNKANLVGTYDDKELVGPIKLNFKGNLSSITINATDNSEIKNYEIYDKNKNKLSGLGSIKSDNEFYIKNTSNKKVKNIKFNVTASETIKAKIYIIENKNASTQRLIIADTEKQPTSASVTVNVNREEEGNIILHKKDSSTGKELQGAKFKVQIQYANNKKGWLAVDSLNTYNYNATNEKATEFETNKDGKIILNNLRSGLQIKIFEVKAPTGYELKDQYGYDATQNRVWCNKAIYTVTTKTTDDTIEIKNSRTGNIEIIKKDKTSAQKLSGAEFKISVEVEGNKTKNTWLKKNNDGTYNYASSFNDATSFKTTDGTVKIEELDTKKYFVYEVKAPTGYNLADQDNYDATNNWVRCGNTQVVSGNTVTVNLNNTKLVAIEGYVWIEKPGTKANEYNDIYDNGEEIITNNVKITLRDKGSNAVVEENPIIKTENGKATYRFEKIDFNKLKDYYVHFDYSEKYKNYITVTANFDIAEGSKAISDDVPEADRDLSGRANTYKGTTDEAKYGLSGLANKFYDETTYTLKNINLGIKELPNTPFTVSENLAYVDMKIKGYNYRYIYGGTGTKVQTVPTIQWQSKTDKESYTRDIYPSDVLYENPSDKTQELQVYATYRIDVTNNTKLDVPYLYQEKYLNVTKVSNKYDTARYELADSNWETTGENSIVQMKNEYLQKQYYDANKNGISNEDEKNNKYAFITFKIKKEALTEMLKSQFGTIEEFPTEAIVTAYHRYTRIDYSWVNNLTKTQTHNTDEATQNDKAPYLGTTPGKNRTISGKVFEDRNARNNGEVVGNGLYDQNENKVQGVTVELGNYNDDGTFVVTDLYVKNEDGTTQVGSDGKLPKATMKSTEKEGTYKFEGVVPGEYLLRYTYGDGTQEIVAPNGNKKVSSDQYKSTIVTEEIKKAFETEYEATKATWYLGMGENHNTAVDNLTQRVDLSKNKYVVDAANIVTEGADNITASTPEFSVPIEFKDKNEASVTEQFPAELGYMDFGIIEMPNTRVGINKKITNIKLTYQNGQVAIDGNPATQNLAYTTDLDKKTNGGSKYVKVELDSKYIYGGTLEIRYEIEITNDSDLDYIEREGSATYGYYYKYGEITRDAHEKTLKVEDAIDYLDPKLSYKSKEGELDIQEINVKEFRNKEAETITPEQNRILALVKAQESVSNSQFDKVIQITGVGTLSSSKGANKDKSSKTVTIDAQKILSSQEDDLEFINIAEVTKVQVEPITPANVEFTSSNATQKIAMTPNVTITITPSTGADRSMIYFVAGAIALVIIAGGIVLIRKNSKK